MCWLSAAAKTEKQTSENGSFNKTMLHHNFFFLIFLCWIVSKVFPLILPLSHPSVLNFDLLPLCYNILTSHIADIFFVSIWGAIGKRKTMTAGGYIDLNIFSVKTCSSLFLRTLQPGRTVTKHTYFDRNYVFPCIECNNMPDCHEVSTSLPQ